MQLLKVKKPIIVPGYDRIDEKFPPFTYTKDFRFSAAVNDLVKAGARVEVVECGAGTAYKVFTASGLEDAVVADTSVQPVVKAPAK